jgi:hypothetical protein
MEVLCPHRAWLSITDHPAAPFLLELAATLHARLHGREWIDNDEPENKTAMAFYVKSGYSLLTGRKHVSSNFIDTKIVWPKM